MVVFAVIVPDNTDDKIKELMTEFNKNMEENMKGITGKVIPLGELALLFYIENQLSMIDLPKRITYWSIKYKWKRKGHTGKFELLSNKKLLELLTKKTMRLE